MNQFPWVRGTLLESKHNLGPSQLCLQARGPHFLSEGKFSISSEGDLLMIENTFSNQARKWCQVKSGIFLLHDFGNLDCGDDGQVYYYRSGNLDTLPSVDSCALFEAYPSRS